MNTTKASSGSDGASIDLTDEQLGARICALASRMAAASCRWLDMIAEFDRRHGWSGYGIASCAHWLAWTCSLSPGAAREHVRVARVVQTMPLIHDAFARGTLSYSKVREVTRVAGAVDEQALLDLARTATASQLQRAVRGFRRSDPDRLNQELRRRARWRVDDDGAMTITATLPAEEGAALLAALETASQYLRQSAADQQRQDPAANSLRDKEFPSPGARARAGAPPLEAAAPAPPPGVNPVDALLELAHRYLATSPEDASGADRNLVLVHVDARNLVTGAEHGETGNPAKHRYSATSGAEPSDNGSKRLATLVSEGPPTGLSDPDDQTAVPAGDACQIAGIGGITPSTAARLACDATILGIIRGPGGAILHHGTRKRLVSAPQRRSLMIRDGGCRYPSCQRTTNLEAHHVKHWALGGKTDLDNLILLCRYHHLTIHEHLAVITITDNSRPGVPRFHFTDPAGVAITGVNPHPDLPARTEEDEIWAHTYANEWNDPEARAIRPEWAGEKFDLGYTVATLFTMPPAAA